MVSASSRPATVLVVTPTLGTRTELLQQSIASLQQQDISFRHVIVSPIRPVTSLAPEAEWAADPGRGLTAAVNAGVEAERGEPYLLWLNDDDLLLPGGLATLVAALDAHPDAVAAMGRARIIGGDGRRIFDSPHPSLVVPLLPWGPGAMFMPSVLLRVSALRRVGGLDEDLVHAADLDLALRLRESGPIVPVPALVASFRWHATSMTVADAARSLAEAEGVRRRHHGRIGAFAYRLWRPLASQLTKRAKARTSAAAERRRPGSEAPEPYSPA